MPALQRLWASEPWTSRADELRSIASQAAEPDTTEHHGLSAVASSALPDGVVLYRVVAGAVGTGEIECVAATTPDVARRLLEAAVADLRERGMRLVIAEYPGGADWDEYAALLATAGFRVRARINDYFADGVPLVVAATGA